MLIAATGAVTVFLIDLRSERREVNRARVPWMPQDGISTSLFFLITVAVAASDGGRFQFPAVPGTYQIGALMLLIPLSSLQIWAMTVNPFFSSVIRLQADRRHRLVSCGPYSLVRHPGYLAMVLTMPATAIALGSWLALLPASAYSAVILRRTIQEDEFLKENLNGYSEYAANVRCRLAPGLW